MKFSDKIQVFLLLVFCLSARLGGQTIWDPKVYHSISAEEKMALLLDNFDDNRYSWGLGQAENDWLEKIADGKLHFQSCNNNDKEDLIKFEILPERDFEIETSIRFIKGDTARFFGLQWGKSSDFNNQFDFMISDNGLVSIDKFSGEFFDYLQPVASEFLKSGHFNKLTIRKINTNYYFFVNEELIYAMPYKPFFGPYFGFQVGENSAIEVDYFKISELKRLNVNTPPDIFLTEPQRIDTSTSVSSAFVTPEKEIMLKGTVMDDGGVYDLFINDQEVFFNTDGEFMTRIPLAPDINLVRIVARDRQLITSEKVLYIQRAVAEQPGDVKNQFATVNYYALLISVGQYDDPAITDLDQPLSDGARLKEVLLKKYTFSEKNISWLKDPNREDLIVAFDNLGKMLTKNDNLLVFYAGHGYWDSNLEVGYWMPRDSKISNPANWFANSTIRDYVRGIKAKHILLISDACFSGGILKTRNVMSNASSGIISLYSMTSRKVMTSGTLTEVPDESVFMKYLIRQLDDNTDRYLSSEQLFSKIKVAVLNNSQTIPQFGTIQDTGDEGGDFIFIRK